MECYSEQMCSIFVDGELAVDEARRLRDHLATCQRCRELLDALRAENRVLGESLHELPEEAVDPVGFPRLRRQAENSGSAGMAQSLQRRRPHEPDLQPFLLLRTRRYCHAG